MRLSFAVPLCVLASLLPAAGFAQKDSDWVGTWTSAAMPLTQPSDKAKLPLGYDDVAVRQVVHISQGGKRLRVAFTNEFGTTPLHIRAAHVAFLAAGSRILPATDKALTFAGSPEITIAPGQFAYSDAVKETVPIFSDVVITTSIPAQTMPTITYHALGMTTTWFAPGGDVAAPEFETPAAVPPGIQPPDVSAPVRSLSRSESPVQEPIVKPQPGADTKTAAAPGVIKTSSWYFLKNVEVNKEGHSAAIVTIGDSITDGARSTPDTNRRWPDQLAPLLAANKKTKRLGILNVGISGNRVLKFGAGPSALDRFDRDVVKQPGAKYVVLLDGINDIGNMHRAPVDAITEKEMLDAYTTLANKAHAAGLKIIAATMTPDQGAKYYSEDGEQIREHVNTFFRTSKLFDGVIDFDKIIADPQHPLQFNPKYDSGDHLHPSDAGYTAMAAGIDLKLFRK
ncbi:SGNH/GDSL hydrolase family protein [Terriglobus sp. TAA 43]|uniref:SGNH/GDSL hydrolase family protein n=1 Tax=Terriglobus sp. TAA 43 TaxID=278961 RepID=UPI0006479883|nr:SGNH/GDSL hydrolase family protein [Terriglobus sp. TAA 43]